MREKTRHFLFIFLFFFFFTCLGFARKTSIPPYNPDAQEKYYFALRHFRHTEYDIALKQFYEVIRDYPSTEATTKAQYMIAETLFKLGRKEEALLAYQEILRLDITNYEACIKIGELYEQFEKYNDSLKAYSRAIELMKYKENIHPRICPSLKKIGDIFFNRKDYINAIEFYKQIMDLDKHKAYTNYIELEQKLASSYLHLKMYKEAEHLYRDLIKNVSYGYRRYQYILALSEILIVQEKDEEGLIFYLSNIEELKEKLYGWKNFQVSIGELYLKNNRLKQWQNILLKEIEEDSSNIYLYILLAGSYAAEKNFLNAADAYQKVLELTSEKAKLKPIYTELLEKLAKYYFKGNEYLKAAGVYGQLILAGKNVEWNLQELARCYIRVKEYEKAEKAFDKLFKKYPNKNNKGKFYSEFFEIYSGQDKDDKAINLALDGIRGAAVLYKEEVAWKLIHAYESNGKSEQLITLLEKKIKEESHDNGLYLLLAANYFSRQKDFLAIEYYEKALKVLPTEVDIYGTLGWLYDRLKDYDKAIYYYKKEIQLAESVSRDIYESLSDLYCYFGRKQDALKLIEELIEKSKGGNKKHIPRTIGNIYRKCEMYNEAIPFYEKATTLSRDYQAHLALSLIECYYQTGNLTKAEELYKEIREKGKQFPHVAEQAKSLLLEFYDTPEKLNELIAKHENILKRYKGLNEIEKRQEKEKAINAGLLLSNIYLENNMPEEKVRVLRTLLEIAPERIDIYDKIADIYFYQIPGGTDKAIRWYKEVIQKKPQDNRALLLLGYAYERKGMYDNASEIYAALMKKPQDKGFWTQCPEARFKSLKLIREKQLIKDWLVIGPFDNTKGKGFDTIYPPEIKINLAQVYEGKENREIKWFRPFKGKFGYVDFDEILSPNEDTVAYALLYIESPTEKEVQFKVGSDDTITIWFNDEKVLSKKVYRGVIIDQDMVNVKLHQGKNRVLVKVCEGKGDWGFYFRITDMYGAPVDDLKYSTTR